MSKILIISLKRFTKLPTYIYQQPTYLPTYLVDLITDRPGDRAGDKTYTQAIDLSTSVTTAHRWSPRVTHAAVGGSSRRPRLPCSFRSSSSPSSPSLPFPKRRSLHTHACCTVRTYSQHRPTSISAPIQFISDFWKHIYKCCEFRPFRATILITFSVANHQREI